MKHKEVGHILYTHYKKDTDTHKEWCCIEVFSGSPLLNFIDDL